MSNLNREVQEIEAELLSDSQELNELRMRNCKRIQSYIGMLGYRPKPLAKEFKERSGDKRSVQHLVNVMSGRKYAPDLMGELLEFARTNPKVDLMERIAGERRKIGRDRKNETRYK